MANLWSREARHESSDEIESVMGKMLGHDSSLNTKNSLPKSFLTGYLLPLGSVLIAAVAFLTQSVQLPKWAIILAVLYLTLVAGFSLYHPALRLSSSAVRRRRLRQLAKTIFPSLAENAKQLGQLVARGQSHTLLYVLHEAGQWEEIRSHAPLLDPEHVETIRSWLNSIERRVARCRRNEILQLCSEFSELVHQYNRFCHQRLAILQTAIAAGRLPEQRLRQLKQQWNLGREGHVAFVRGWENLSRAINETVGNRRCIEYYEPVGTLE